MPDLQQAGVSKDARSPSVWRPRRDKRLDFARRHSFTIEQLARLAFAGRTLEARKKKASRWVADQRRRGRIHVVGVVQRRDTGRPEVVHGRRCKQTEVEHEVIVAEFEVLTNIRLERSKKRARTEPDGTGETEGNKVSVEIDNSGKMTVRKQMEAKWKR